MVDLQKFLSSISGSNAIASGSVSTPPEPARFVPPPLTIQGESTDFNAEVLILEAAAAVGKSELSKYVAANKSAPWLDLRAVPVGTQSLAGFLSNDLTPANPIDEFHAGKVPFVVDGLDEGPTSSPKGFDPFLETTGELVSSSRKHPDRPKLIMFARSDSAKRMVKWCQEHDLEWRLIKIEFFGEDSAREVIYLYSDVASPGKPHRQFVDAYFSGIESALGISEGELFQDSTGRSFAGYAPVLRALGRVVADERNIHAAKEQLIKDGASDAWLLLERVISTLLSRERDVLTDLLDPKVASALPYDSFNNNEQLALLAMYVPAGVIDPRVPEGLTQDQTATYDKAVRDRLPQHPFMGETNGGITFNNEVFGSLVLAEGIISDNLTNDHDPLLASASRQPFLWRAIQSRLATNDVLDGRYVGYILRSLWNDPLTPDEVKITIDEAETGFGQVRVKEDQDELAAFEVLPDITLYGDISNCSISGVATVLRGDEGSLLSLSELSIGPEADTSGQADKVILHGTVDLRSKNYNWSTSGGQPVIVSLEPKSELIISGGFETFPWNQVGHSPQSPMSTAYDDLIAEWRSYYPTRSKAPTPPPTLEPSFLPSESESRLSWVLKDDRYTVLWPVLVKALIEHGLAKDDHKKTTQTGVAHVTIHFNVGWDELTEGNDAVRTVVNEASKGLD